jgi:hypothetical protein
MFDGISFAREVGAVDKHFGATARPVYESRGTDRAHSNESLLA